MTAVPADWLRPPWRGLQASACVSTRHGGVSRPPYESMNVGAAVGDAADAVAANRARLAQACGAVPVFLKQVHGARVVRLSHGDAQAGAAVYEADASVSTEAGIACTVLVADCLPVLLAAPGGLGVAAAHAGWRGLAGGVLEATVAALSEASGCAPGEIHAWLGPCIGPRRFEVGDDVLRAFGAAASHRFVPGAPGKWLADLPGLARDRLGAAGVSRIEGGAWCTVENPSRFFSFRRDGITGRMAAAIWIDAG